VKVMVRIEIPEDQKRPEVVREALRGRVDLFPPSLALDLVPELDVPEEERRDIIREAVADRALEPHVRVAAVYSLAKLGPDVAVPELVKVVEASDADEEVRAAAAAVLGRFGTLEHLPPLETLRKSATSDVTRRAATFAETLIVHRTGNTKHEVDLPPAEAQPAPEPTGAIAFISRKPGSDRAKRALASVHRQFPSIDPKAHEVHELQCGPQLLEVIVSRAAVGTKTMKTLTTQPAMPAVIALRSEETNDFYPAYLVLTRPTRAGEISLVVTRLDGDPVFIGKGSIKAAAAEADLRAVKSPGIPAISARIRATDRGFEVSGHSARRGIPARRPQRVELPPS
jgi:HEAT repeats